MVPLIEALVHADAGTGHFRKFKCSSVCIENNIVIRQAKEKQKFKFLM